MDKNTGSHLQEIIQTEEVRTSGERLQGESGQQEAGWSSEDVSKMNLFLLVLGTELRTSLHAKANPLPLSPTPPESLLICRFLVKYAPCKCESLSVEPILMEKSQV